MKKSLFRILTASALAISIIGSGVSVQPVNAQQSKGLVYIVQENDTIYSISRMFHSSVYRLEIRNYLNDSSVISAGDKLYIPGFDDLSGTLSPVQISIGDTPLSLMRASRMDRTTFNRINFLTSSDAAFVGQKFFTLVSDSKPTQLRVPVTDGGLTGLETAARSGTNPWTLAEYNSLPGTWYLVPNDILYLPASSSSNEILPGIQEIDSTDLQQGVTAVFTAKGSSVSNLKANLDFPVDDLDTMQKDASAGKPITSIPIIDEIHTLNFFPNTDGNYVALQGVPRMTVPGMALLTLSIQTADGANYSLDQNIKVKQVDYGYDAPMQVADNEVDPAVTIPEAEFYFKTVAPATSEKMWSGPFLPPTSTPTAINDVFGRLRAFNGSDWIYWHSGLDYAGGEGVPILAMADGTVIYTGELTVRGNATIIDHGWGVYTVYCHQSKVEVKVGDKVKAGQEIGLIGATGRVTGPHLHLDVIVGGVQVDPEQWLTQTLP